METGLRINRLLTTVLEGIVEGQKKKRRRFKLLDIIQCGVLNEQMKAQAWNGYEWKRAMVFGPAIWQIILDDDDDDIGYSI